MFTARPRDVDLLAAGALPRQELCRCGYARDGGHDRGARTRLAWEGLLYWRRLECADSRQEGAFLAGTFWVAQYWIERGDLERGRRIIDAGLAYANDLGLFAEGADPHKELMLGNFPQSFVHAAFIGSVIDLKSALAGGSSRDLHHARNHFPPACRSLGRA